MSAVLERFLNYIKTDTTSSEEGETYPSTDSQKKFGESLAAELRRIGISDVLVDEYGYVTGTIPETVSGAPVIGLIAHMDTSSEMRGDGIKPQVIDYQGGDIVLNEHLGIVMEEEIFPRLKGYTGQKLIVTDGTTLLGADDKAGIAEIVSAAEFLLENKQVLHGKIRLAFTPDEEIGKGTKYFDVEGFGADFAYTVDGGALGSIEYENFNAATAKIEIHGVSIHPGSAKDKMKNSIRIAMELDSLLPNNERPEFTEDYEGFYHLNAIHGDVSAANMNYIIRDHDMEKFNNKKKRLEKVVHYLNDKYGRDTVSMTIMDSYFNMKEKVAEHMELIDYAKEAFTECSVTPVVEPIRGGTDGARLSYRGLPCPNLSTGGENFHGKYEFIPVESLEKMVDVLVRLVGKFV